MYINFLSSISRPLLETLASQVAASNTSNLVSQVYDQYLNFVVSEENLFSCEIPGVYRTLNDPSVAETVIEDTINQIVSSLFSVAVTLGVFAFCLDLSRCNADNSMPKRKCCGDDRSASGWQVARLLYEFPGNTFKYIFYPISRKTGYNALQDLPNGSNDYPRSKLGSHSYDLP